MSTGSRPAVRSPTAARAAAGSSSSVSGSTSQNTGVAPSYRRQFADATKLSGEVTTSSPGPQPNALTPRCSAAVPLDTATASPTPSHSASARSNLSSIGPSDSAPERSTSSTSSSSRSPISGRESGMGSVTGPSERGGPGGRGFRLEGVLERVDQRLPRRLDDDVLRHADRAPLV